MLLLLASNAPHSALLHRPYNSLCNINSTTRLSVAPNICENHKRVTANLLCSTLVSNSRVSTSSHCQRPKKEIDSGNSRGKHLTFQEKWRLLAGSLLCCCSRNVHNNANTRYLVLDRYATNGRELLTANSCCSHSSVNA